MIVSNFEVGMQHRSGSSSRTGWQNTSYRLQITNLEDKEIEFLVECCLAMAPSQAESRLAANSLQASVTAKSSMTYPFRRRGESLVGGLAFRLAPSASVIYELQKTVHLDGMVCGYIALRVPPRRTGQGRFLLTAQQGRPVRVLLHANREDYRPSFSASALDFDGVARLRTAVGDWQSNQAIALASGKAENEIAAEGFGSLSHIHDFVATLRRQELDYEQVAGALLLPEEERLPALLDLLAAVEQDEAQVRALNEALEELNTGVRLRLAKAKPGRDAG